MMYDDRTTAMLTAANAAIVTVGEGRGFIVEVPEISDDQHIIQPADRFIITAAHCLPELPPPHPFSYNSERTYHALLGPLGAAPTVSAECGFVDPLADLAVLWGPDDQTYFDESYAYNALVGAGSALRLGVEVGPQTAWLLALDGQWATYKVHVNAHGPARTLTVVAAAEPGFAPGTSGSPIIGHDGRALGVVSVSATGPDSTGEEQPRQPLLASNLPAWLRTLLAAA
jgi:hypothetical protein